MVEKSAETPLDRLRDAVAVHQNRPDDELAIMATSVFADGKLERTGVTWGDLRRIVAGKGWD